MTTNKPEAETQTTPEPKPGTTGKGVNLYELSTELLRKLDDKVLPDIKTFLKYKDEKMEPVSERDKIMRKHTDSAMAFTVDLLRELHLMFKEGYIPAGELPTDEDLLAANKYFMDNLSEYKYYDDPRSDFHWHVHRFFDKCLEEKYETIKIGDHFQINPKPLSETRPIPARGGSTFF